MPGFVTTGFQGAEQAFVCIESRMSCMEITIIAATPSCIECIWLASLDCHGVVLIFYVRPSLNVDHFIIQQADIALNHANSKLIAISDRFYGSSLP